MTLEPTTIDTRLATIERRRADLLFVHYKPSIVFDVDGIGEVIAACERLPGTSAFGMVTTIPDDAELSVRAMQRDHFEGADSLTARIRAMALVASTQFFLKLTDIYFTYHPQGFEVKIFTDEDEAVAWVEQRLGDRSVA